MKSIILLSGPVGAGKTTVAKALVEISPSPLACIEGDTYWQFLAKSDASIGPEKPFRAIMAAMMASAVALTRSGYETIVDFSIPPWFLPTCQKLAMRREIPLHYVVIWPTLEICALRAAEREEGAIEDYSRYRELHDDFRSTQSRMLVDSDATPAIIAAEIRGGLDSGRFLVS